MYFYNDEWNDSDEVIVYGYYHKYWSVYKQEKNPRFDIYSGKILDLKEGKDTAINYFYNLLNQELCKGIAVCVVPSHDNNQESGIIKLGKLLAQDGRVDKVHFLLTRKFLRNLLVNKNAPLWMALAREGKCQLKLTVLGQQSGASPS